MSGETSGEFRPLRAQEHVHGAAVARVGSPVEKSSLPGTVDEPGHRGFLQPDRGRPLTWIEIGSAAGPTAPIPSAALRAAHLQIVGSGQGSVTAREILAELPALAQEITNGTFDIDARPTPLADVEQAWADAAHTTQRIVLTPSPDHPRGACGPGFRTPAHPVNAPGARAFAAPACSCRPRRNPVAVDSPGSIRWGYVLMSHLPLGGPAALHHLPPPVISEPAACGWPAFMAGQRAVVS